MQYSNNYIFYINYILISIIYAQDKTLVNRQAEGEKDRPKIGVVPMTGTALRG